MYFNIYVLFFVNTTSILKLVFHTVYAFCLDGYFGGSVVAIIVTVVVVFIYLFIIFSLASTVILMFVVVVVIAAVAFFLLESSLPFVCVFDYCCC